MRTIAIVVTLIRLTGAFALEPQDQPVAPFERLAISECGVATLEFAEGHLYAAIRIEFQQEYRSKPLVIVSEYDSSGTFVVLKAENLSNRGCSISGWIVADRPPTYKCQVAYVVIADPARRFAGKDRKPAKRVDRAQKKRTKDAESNEAIKNSLTKSLEGKLNERLRNRIVEIRLKGTGKAPSLIIVWDIRDDLKDEMRYMSAIDDVENILDIISQSKFEYSTARFEGRCQLGGDSDSTRKGIGLRASYIRRTVDKIDWGDFNFDIRKFAKSWTPHRQLKRDVGTFPP